MLFHRSGAIGLYTLYVCDNKYSMMTSSNGNIFRVTGLLCGEFTGHQWIPLTKGQWRGALIFSLICAWINAWVNNREAGNLRRHRAHYDVIVMDEVRFVSKQASLKYHPVCEGHRKQQRIVNLTTLSSLVAPEVVILTTYGADDKFVKSMTICFHW